MTVSSQLHKGTTFTFTVNVELHQSELPNADTVPEASFVNLTGQSNAQENETVCSNRERNKGVVNGRLEAEAIPLPYRQNTTQDRSESAIATTLQSMPLAWQKQLYQAALELNGREVLALLKQIPPTHQATAEHLINLAKNYEFESLLNLLE